MKTLCALAFLVLAASASAQPWQPQVIWDRSGLQDSSAYGYRILPLGDQNNDGYADWGVFAWGVREQEAYVELFHGGNPPTTTPFRSFHGDPGGSWWVFDADVAGDLNGDGYVDWFVSRRDYPTWIQQHVSIYFGGPQSDTAAAMNITISVSNWLIAIGDLNGDHYDDLCLRDNLEHANRIFYGGDTMDTLPDWVSHAPTGPGGVEDINGDGYSDFVCGATGPRTLVFYGGSPPDTTPADTLTNFTHWPIGAVRDLNGDGFDDIVFPLYHGAQILYGGMPLDTVLDRAVAFPCTLPWQGASARDINRDGYQDFMLWTDDCSGGGDWGVLSLYLGRPVMDSLPVLTMSGGSLGLTRIWTAAGIGDANGDGVEDFAIGAWDDITYEACRGRCIIIAGDSTIRVDAKGPYAPLPERLAVSLFPNPFNSAATIQLEVPSGIDQATLTTFNLLGQCVQSLRIPVTPGVTRRSYYSSGWASGIYFLTADAGSFHFTQKFVVLK